MKLWDNAVAITKAAGAATAASVTILAAAISGFTTGQKLEVSVDGGAPVEVTLSGAPVSKTNLASDLDAALNPGADAVVVTNDVTLTSATTGTGSSIVIRNPDTPAVLTISAADLAVLIDDPDDAGDELAHWRVGTKINVWVDGARDGVEVTLSGVTAAAIASDLDAVAGITAVEDSGDVVITTASTGSAASVRVDDIGTASGSNGSVLYSATGTAGHPNGTGPVDYHGIYIGGTGNLKVTLKSGAEVTFNSIPVGFYPLHIIEVWDSGTTTTNMLGLTAGGIAVIP
jgi:hypothetical protein